MLEEEMLSRNHVNWDFYVGKLWETVLHTAHIDVPSNSPHPFANHERSLKVNEKYRLMCTQRASERLYIQRIR